MKINEMREALLKVYDSATWKSKVTYMTDAEVVAIYNRMSHNGLLKGKS